MNTVRRHVVLSCYQTPFILVLLTSVYTVFLGSSVTGMNRHTTARIAPTSAIHTTDTAEGTRAPTCLKCSFANRNPNALLFIAVSMAMVRLWVSVNPNHLGSQYPASPPTRCSSITGSWRARPAERMAGAHWATAEATNKHVDNTPTTGHISIQS